MPKLYLYADESCHTVNSSFKGMSLVTVFCKGVHRKLINKKIESIMNKYGINLNSELKWTKVSPSNVDMYIEIISFLHRVSTFGDLGIRAIYITDKNNISSDYNEWYHKMYYLLYRKIISDFSRMFEEFHVLVDYKDNRSHIEIPKIGRFLENYTHGWEKLITTVANSKEHRLIQIADVIAGSITYYKRGLQTSEAKLKIIHHIFNLFDISYNQTTSLNKIDFNYFIWSSKNA